MSRPLVRITCPIHKSVTVARIESSPEGALELVVWERDFDIESTGPSEHDYRLIFDGRTAKPAEKERFDLLSLDPEPARSRTTWCRKCRGEYSLELDRLIDALSRGLTAIACTPHDPVVFSQLRDDVLDFSQEESPGPEVQ
jgi:hypothetical protein